MMMKTKLAAAVAVASAVLSMGASAATTMYNTYNAGGLNGNTDGWTHTNGVTNSGPLQPWIGTSGQGFNDTRPFNFAGNTNLSWAVQLTGGGDSGVVSAADSTARYSPAGSTPDANYVGPAEVDTGGGAWQDNSATPTGWKHQTDIGLIKSNVTTLVNLKPLTLGGQSPTFSQFGITVFTGQDTTTAAYSHHGAWNCPGCATPSLFTKSNPSYGAGVGSGVVYNAAIGASIPGQAYSSNVDGLTGFTFLAQANQVYSVYLGGVGFSRWNTGVDNYQLTVSAVPIPAAAWLFGSALAGMGVFGRRKDKAGGAA
jgi:hypothetical protein